MSLVPAPGTQRSPRLRFLSVTETLVDRLAEQNISKRIRHWLLQKWKGKLESGLVLRAVRKARRDRAPPDDSNGIKLILSSQA